MDSLNDVDEETVLDHSAASCGNGSNMSNVNVSINICICIVHHHHNSLTAQCATVVQREQKNFNMRLSFSNYVHMTKIRKTVMRSDR